MEVSGQLHTPAALPPPPQGKSPSLLVRDRKSPPQQIFRLKQQSVITSSSFETMRLIQQWICLPSLTRFARSHKLGSMTHKVASRRLPALSPRFRDKFLAFSVLLHAFVPINFNLFTLMLHTLLPRVGSESTLRFPMASHFTWKIAPTV
jgi:hypothetical protein